MTEREGHDSRAVANRFVRLAQDKGESISILQLVKFVYLAHGWHLGFHNTPLICHEVQAWRLGPVVPEVYHAFRPQGVVVATTAKNYGYFSTKPYRAKIEEEAESLIERVFNAYGKLPGYALSALTHEPGTPWDQVKDKGYYAKIPNDIIRDYYRRKIKEKPTKDDL